MINRKHVVIAALCGCLAAGTAIINYADGDNANVGSTTGEATLGSAAAGRGKSSNGEVAIASLNPASDTAARTINTPEELNALKQMEQVSETDALALFINKETAEIAVKDKRDGYVWFSNPIGHQKDTLASPLYQSELSSQLLLTYYNEKGQVYRFNSYDDSVEKKQFEITAAKNGVRIVYRFGKASGGTENIPAVISKERFQKLILDKLPDDDARKQVSYKFRLNQEKQVYEVRNLQDNVKQELAGYLTQAGYTKEDAAQDNQENGAEAAASDEQAAFTIPVEYALDADQFVVSIAAKDVRYSPEFPLASVQLLKHFGAATDKKQGYIFVPDGSGALIQLNNKKLSAEPFNMPVYGEDGTFDVKERVVTSSPVRLPVFGLKQNDHALLGIIEDGDALSSVLADISGRHDSYNTVNAEFQFVAMDYYTLSSGTKTSSVPMFQQQPYQGDLRVRYSFLSGSAADYVGMAGAYRNYLIDKYKLKKLDEQANAPFILEVEGAFRKKKSFLGIPYSATESLTTYDEAGSMLKLLKTQGIDTIALRYVGWFNDGIRHSSPKDVELEGALGGKKGLQRLIDYTKQNGVGLYPDVAFLEKYKGAKDSADLLDRRSAAVYNYNPVMYVQDSDSFSHYKLSPNKLPSTVDAFMNDYAKFGISGLSLRDMGNEVNSDFDPQASVDRQAARNTILRETDKLKQQSGRLMISGGNAYTLPYADIVVHAPTSSNRLNITDEDVMFYQIALHGYVDLAGAPFNMDGYQNPRASMLKALETGSNIYYAWYYNEASVVKDTAYNDLYALHYADWFDEAAQLYNEANPILKQVRNQVITGHRNLADRVVETTFENGMTIIVNYNQTAVQVNGMEIGAESYRVGGE
ncbi:DUF5696 domain-containing protein [Paenibacillus sp. BC26]|uniref:DUF5696 domain-containing protein n=1 Tax=Paenibacillus sp. BC26 TaxID=1881032 RepID=UPI0008EEF715|nr:DUF5696 domain-containing protein [Paenibacillus sp. BC26]SFS60332.1 hypothetical protein SAMN05428962_1331 [Paenibacillus sp. BC26]